MVSGAASRQRRACEGTTFRATLWAVGIVDGRNIHQIIEIGFQFQKFENGDDGIGFRDYEVLSQIGRALHDLVAKPFLQLFR